MAKEVFWTRESTRKVHVFINDEVVDAKRVEDRATCAIVEGALRGGALW